MVLVLLTHNFEEIEALTVVDVLRRAELEVKTCSIEEDLYVTGSHEITVKADMQIDQVNADEIDLLVLPGGPGTPNLDQSEKVDQLIKAHIANGKLTAAICAAPFVLGKRGYLKGKKATCFPGYEKYLEGATISTDKVVTDLPFITAKGAGAAMAFALELVRLTKGEELKNKLFNAMQC